MEKIEKIVQVSVKHVDILPEVFEENIIYISKKFKISAHSCLCGCRNIATTPFEHNFSGVIKGWRIVENGNFVTFSPSLLNTNCPNRAHYIITNNVARFV